MKCNLNGKSENNKAALASDLLKYFRLLLLNDWAELNNTEL